MLNRKCIGTWGEMLFGLVVDVLEVYGGCLGGVGDIHGILLLLFFEGYRFTVLGF